MGWRYIGRAMWGRLPCLNLCCDSSEYFNVKDCQPSTYQQHWIHIIFKNFVFIFTRWNVEILALPVSWFCHGVVSFPALDCPLACKGNMEQLLACGLVQCPEGLYCPSGDSIYWCGLPCSSWLSLQLQGHCFTTSWMWKFMLQQWSKVALSLKY